MKKVISKESIMIKGIMVYGYGKLGDASLEGLDNQDVALFYQAFNAPGEKEFTVTFGRQKVSVLNSSRLTESKNVDLFAEYKKMVSHILVTLPGAVLENEIYFLEKFKIPLIICSTGYDEILVANVLLNSGVPAVMSQNMAFAITDLWGRLEEMISVPDGSDIVLESAIESHQSGKADISGSILKVFSILKEKGIKVDFDKSCVNYDGIKDGKCGCLSWLREEPTQLHYGVPEKFLGGHAFHRFCITAKDDLADTQDYMDILFKELSSLSEYSVDGMLRFSVVRHENSIIITHNIMGREIYSRGIYECMKFLDIFDEGVFSGSDVVMLNKGGLLFSIGKRPPIARLVVFGFYKFHIKKKISIIILIIKNKLKTLCLK